MEKITSTYNTQPAYSVTQPDTVQSTQSKESALASPAVSVNFSTNAMLMSSYSRASASVKATIDQTKGSLLEAIDETEKFYNNYDEGTYGDHYIQAKGITDIIDSMWENNLFKRYQSGEWATHGKIINGRKTVLEGPDDIQWGMTRLFNDLKFDSKEHIYRSLSTMRYAYNAMITTK